MKKLFLIRHAHTQSPNVHLDDFDRQLTSKGLLDAERIGKVLVKENIQVDKIICSAALRAHTTAHKIAENIDYDASAVTSLRSLYEQTAYKLLNFINTIEDQYDTVLLINHNPSISNLVESLIDKTIEGMMPGSMAYLELPVDSWADVYGGIAHLHWLRHPDFMNV